MKLNNADNYESVFVQLDPIKHPITYQAKVDDLLLSGMSQSEAEKIALEPIEMELYFDQSTTLFMVDPCAVESGTIYNPYSGELMEDSEGTEW